MKEYRLSVPWMYFTGIERGKITALFFDKVPYSLDGIKTGDLVKINLQDSCQKMYFERSNIISFNQVDDDLVKRAGFATKELLSYHLMDRFNIANFGTSKHSKINNELFYVIYLIDDPEKITFNDGECCCTFKKNNNVFSTYLNNKYVKEWSKKNKPYTYTTTSFEYDKDLYNPEYDDKPWRTWS